MIEGVEAEGGQVWHYVGTSVGRQLSQELALFSRLI